MYPSVEKNTPDRALLQNMLDDFMKRHASLLQSILDREQHPDMTTARKLSDLDQKQWRRKRQKEKV
jgi:hypothetical protein